MAEEEQNREAIRRIALALWPKGLIGERAPFVSIDELETAGTLVPRICDEITNRTSEMWRGFRMANGIHEELMEEEGQIDRELERAGAKVFRRTEADYEILTTEGWTARRLAAITQLVNAYLATSPKPVRARKRTISARLAKAIEQDRLSTEARGQPLYRSIDALAQAAGLTGRWVKQLKADGVIDLEYRRRR